MESEIDTDLDNLNLRLHRAESWLRRGEEETDADAKYIFLWIAFNAAYGVSGKDKKDKEVLSLLLRLFRRLNVLRNQLMHGSATQDGSLNRRQVDAGANVLGPLVRVFLDIMVANPKEGWGPPRYPVRNDIREDR